MKQYVVCFHKVGYEIDEDNLQFVVAENECEAIKKSKFLEGWTYIVVKEVPKM